MTLANERCTVRLDRLAFGVPREKGDRVKYKKPPTVPGFKTVDHKFPRLKGRQRTWRQVLFMESPKTGTKIRVQYDRAHGYLKPMRVTVIGPDETGILWTELKAIGDAFGDFLISMLEIAFDFSSESGVDKEFVAKHGRFGKSHSVPRDQYPGTLRYGSRRSAKMVRCYWKHEVQAFRVELELHSGWPGLPETDCLLYAFSIGPNDFSFVRVDWRRLDRYFASMGRRGQQMAAEARSRYTSLHDLLNYLRASGVNNPRSFLKTMNKDQLIREAIRKWTDSLRPGTRGNESMEEADDDQ